MDDEDPFFGMFDRTDAAAHIGGRQFSLIREEDGFRLCREG